MRARGNPLFACNECDDIFTTKLKLKKHKMAFHQYVKCPLCHETFTNHIYNAFHKHEACMTSSTKTITIKSQDNTRYHCPVCDKTFIKLRSLKRHIVMHTSKNPVRCGYCGQFYLDVNRLTRHIKLRHSTDKKAYHDCDMCNKRYMSLHKFEVHKQTHLGEEKSPRYYCIYCSNKYDKLGHFKEHMRRKHGNRSITRNMTCGICQNTHLMRDDIGKNLIYICDSCQNQLAIQDSNHSPGSKYFDCLSCAKSFKRTVALYRHILNFHTPAVCHQCNTSYPCLRNLIRHERRIHQHMILDCPQCGLWFRNRIYLSKHLLNRHQPNSYERQYYRIFQKYYRLAKGVDKINAKHRFDQLIENKEVNATNLKCPVCDMKAIDSLKSLRTHLNTNHSTLNYYPFGKPALPNYTCPLCKRTLLNCKYGEHLVNKPSPTHRWKCKLCPNNTLVLNSIVHKVKHLQTHHNLMQNKCVQCWKINRRRKVCVYCGKHFSAAHMYPHCLLYHLEEIPFCDYCQRYFINEDAYEDHMEITNNATTGEQIKRCLKRRKKKREK
ncbi:hypothetical protein WDU94_012864 [Cyamophila willieti]